MMTDDQSRIFLADPYPSHPRVTIRIGEINVPCDKNVLIIRAPGRKNEHTKNRDFPRGQPCGKAAGEKDWRAWVDIRSSSTSPRDVLIRWCIGNGWNKKE